MPLLRVCRDIRKPVSSGIDRILNTVKWPAAVLLALFFPSSLFFLWSCLRELISSNGEVPFVAGVLVFIGVNKVMRTTMFWSWLRVFEHELVHVLLVLACLKVPKRWKVSSNGGHVGFDSGGNWLITLSPYVVPLIPMATFLALTGWSVFSPLKSWIMPFAMGFSLGCHTAFTWWESEFRQPDIQKIGPLFALIATPTMHSLCLSAIFLVSAHNLGPADLLESSQDEPGNTYNLNEKSEEQASYVRSQSARDKAVKPTSSQISFDRTDQPNTVTKWRRRSDRIQELRK